MKRAPVPVLRIKEDLTAQFLPFYLPDDRKRNYRIESKVEPAGSRYPVVSMRNSIFMGLPSETMLFTEPIRLHYLVDQHGVLMSTIPQEVEQVHRQCMRAHGEVLVGGLGLGVAASVLSQNPRVTRVIVIELSKSVIGLVQPYLPKGKIDVIHDDLRGFLRGCQKDGITYDFAFYDTWRGTGEWDHFHEVLPLRRLSEGVVKQEDIQCWNEAEMLGQIITGIHTKITMRHTEHMKEFFKNEPNDKYWRNQSQSAFLVYLIREKPTDKVAMKKLGEYIIALQDPALFRRNWKQYTTTNKRKVNNNDSRET